MTISRRLAIGYGIMSGACMLLVAWLGYHEFVKEPAEFAAHGLVEVHKDTAAEFTTVCFLALVPVMLGFGWWWLHRVFAPLRALTDAVEKIQSHNLQLAIPASKRTDEVATLAAVFAAMTSRLDASFRQIREFTLHASHELKTPLTVMRAQLETELRENQTLTPQQSDRIESLLDEVGRLTKIVDSLTLLTKADAGLVTLETAPVSLEQLVQECFEDALILAQPNHINVTLAESCVALVQGDRHRLRQLLLILVDNAVKYNRSGGRIELRLRKHEYTVEFRVVNDSEPISPEAERRLFDRFARGENAMGKVDGSGLGLNIAQWIVHAHDGHIELRSSGTGQVETVVRIPLAKDSTPEPVANETVLQQTSNSK
jgi:signal transduction histidine kinase